MENEPFLSNKRSKVRKQEHLGSKAMHGSFMTKTGSTCFLVDVHRSVATKRRSDVRHIAADVSSPRIRYGKGDSRRRRPESRG